MRRARDDANEDRDHATPYALGVATKACLQSGTDIDFYQFTLPSTPVQGGFVKVQITDVGTTASVSTTAYAAFDNGEFISTNNPTQGGSAFLYFAGKAGATFRLKVERYITLSAPTPYTLTATFTGVNDTNEPNDTNATATPITLGTAASGYLFAGYEASTAPNPTVWEDRFKITLPQGDATFTLTVPPDIDGEIDLYNALGSLIDLDSDPRSARRSFSNTRSPPRKRASATSPCTPTSVTRSTEWVRPRLLSGRPRTR